MPESTAQIILSEVERLDPEVSGAFVVDIADVSVGTVFVEKNQVCWAAYTGLRRRLRDLLREHLMQSLTTLDLELQYQESAKHGRRLGEDLVARDVVKAEAMRRALKEHTIESLLALPQAQGEHIEWVPHRNQGYQPRFTFTPCELLLAVNARLYSIEAAGVEMSLAIIDADESRGDARGASFVTGDDGGLLAVHSVGGFTIAELEDLGVWAEAAFSVTRGFSREVMQRAIANATSEVSIAWRTSRAQTHTAVVSPGPCLTRLMAKIESGAFPAVVSRRASSSSLAVRGGLGAVDSNP